MTVRYVLGSGGRRGGIRRPRERATAPRSSRRRPTAAITFFLFRVDAVLRMAPTLSSRPRRGGGGGSSGEAGLANGASPTALFAVLLLALLGAANGEVHDPSSAAAPPSSPSSPRYRILVVIPFGDTSHSFDLLTVAGRLAKR